MPSMMSMNPIIIVRSETQAQWSHGLEKKFEIFKLDTPEDIRNAPLVLTFGLKIPLSL